MESLKDQVISVINQLPNDVTIDDIMEALYVQKKIMKGIEQLDNGQYITHEEMKERLKKWLI